MAEILIKHNTVVDHRALRKRGELVMKKLDRILQKYTLTNIAHYALNKIKNLKRASLRQVYRFRRVTVVMVDGGLGSQICKFAFGMNVEQKTHATVYYDLSWFNENGRSIDGADSRSYQLEVAFPSIQLRKATHQMIEVLKENALINKYPHIYDESIFKTSPVYYGGYYVHQRYFEDIASELRRKLAFSSEIEARAATHLEDICSSSNSVAIHVRRGDYVNTIHDVLGASYYLSAIKRMGELIQGELSLFFFSDDIPWVKDNIAGRIDSRMRIFRIDGDSESGYLDMFLMSKCNHFIISNSSFSWIPAWLGNSPNKKVIMPSQWYNFADDSTCGSETAFVIDSAIAIHPGPK